MYDLNDFAVPYSTLQRGCRDQDILDAANRCLQADPANYFCGYHPYHGWFVGQRCRDPENGESLGVLVLKDSDGGTIVPAMSVHASSAFSIGTSHSVCQDYARVRPWSRDCGITAVAVSDGCSSSADTDIGARSLTLAALEQLRLTSCARLDNASIAHVLNGAFQTSSGACSLIGQYALDATLLLASKQEDVNFVHVQLFGDGAVVVKRRDGDLVVHEVSAAGGAPAYLSYRLHDNRFRMFVKETNGAVSTVRTYVNGELVVTWTAPFTRDPSGDDPLFAGNRTAAALTGIEMDIPVSRTELVMVASDGLASFQKTTGMSPVPVDVCTVARHLADVKSPAGDFMSRRLRAFEKKTCRSEGWEHYDDLAVAALYLEVSR